MRINENDYANWWASPVGKEVRQMLKERIQKIDSQWNSFVGNDVLLAKMAGRKEEIQDLMDMTFKELVGDE